MPEFRQPDEAEEESRGEGWHVSVLADGRHMDALGMAARRWTVEPSRRTTEWHHTGPEERFLYVISGHGTALVGAERWEIGPEDVIWLEAGDTVALVAGDEKLRVLDAASTQGTRPARRPEDDG